MIKGTIMYGHNEEATIKDCDILVVVGIKKLDENVDGNEYMSQNILLGGCNPDHFIGCLADSIVSQIGEMGKDEPVAAYVMMQMFKEHILKKTDEYMFCNLNAILAAKERQDEEGRIS